MTDFVLSIQNLSNQYNNEVVTDLKDTINIFQSLLHSQNLIGNITDSKNYNPVIESNCNNKFSLTNIFNNLEKVIDNLKQKNEEKDSEKYVK